MLTFTENEKTGHYKQETHSVYAEKGYIGTIYCNPDQENPYSFLLSGCRGGNNDPFNSVYDKRLDDVKSSNLDDVKSLISSAFAIMSDHNKSLTDELSGYLKDKETPEYDNNCTNEVDLQSIHVSVFRSENNNCICFPMKLTIDEFAKIHVYRNHNGVDYHINDVRFKRTKDSDYYRDGKYGFDIPWKVSAYSKRENGLCDKAWRSGDFDINIHGCYNFKH